MNHMARVADCKRHTLYPVKKHRCRGMSAGKLLYAFYNFLFHQFTTFLPQNQQLFCLISLTFFYPLHFCSTIGAIIPVAFYVWVWFPAHFTHNNADIFVLFSVRFRQFVHPLIPFFCSHFFCRIINRRLHGSAPASTSTTSNKCNIAKINNFWFTAAERAGLQFDLTHFYSLFSFSDLTSTSDLICRLSAQCRLIVGLGWA